MKYYFYSENEQQLGPFTLDELEAKRIKKSTLVWTDGLPDWIAADKVNELKNIIISEPPPLPKKTNRKRHETVTIKESPSLKVDAKFGSTYQQETGAIIFGLFLFLSPIIIQLTGILTFDDIESYQQGRMWVALGILAIRIVATLWAVNIAKRKNRNKTGWGWLTFFFPGISLIILGQLRKLKLEIEIDGNLPRNEQISILMEKANEQYSAEKFQETIEILNKAIEFESKNYEALLLQAKSYYKIEEFNEAKKRFELLKDIEQINGEANLYLGLIVSQKYKYDEAIEYWKIALKNGCYQAKIFLNIFSNFKGKYLLKQDEIIKKVGTQISASWIDLGHGNGQYLKGISEADNISWKGSPRTSIILHKFGFVVKLTKLFSSRSFAVNYLEIKDIVNKDKTLDFILFDNSIVSFTFDSDKDTNRNVEEICRNFTQLAGFESSIMSERKK